MSDITKFIDKVICGDTIEMMAKIAQALEVDGNDVMK